MRLIPAALAALALAAPAITSCGGERQLPSGSATELLTEAAARVHEQETFSFSFEYLRVRDDRRNDPERYGRGDGALDLASGRGRLALDLGVGIPAVDGRYAVRWSSTEVQTKFGSERFRASRDDARERAGLVGRLPDEPEAVVALLERGRDARLVDERELGGRRLTVVRFTVDAREAGRLGAPAEVALAAASGGLGDRLDLEAWIDEDRLPRRIVMELALDPVSNAGRLLLPGRTVTITYELADFGEPQTRLQFASQAG